MHTSDYYVISEKQTATVVLQLICLLTVVYCFDYLCSPILWSVFLFIWSVIFKAINANPQPALFRVTNIWRNATLPAVRCKKFYILQGSAVTFFLVWWVRG